MAMGGWETGRTINAQKLRRWHGRFTTCTSPTLSITRKKAAHPRQRPGADPLVFLSLMSRSRRRSSFGAARWGKSFYRYALMLPANSGTLHLLITLQNIDKRLYLLSTQTKRAEQTIPFQSAFRQSVYIEFLQRAFNGLRWRRWLQSLSPLSFITTCYLF